MELTGRTLGHYLIQEEISRGGMGVVYRATDTRLNRDVALKVLPQDVTTDENVRRRFLKEAQAASALEHPHIAVIHGADEVDGIAYIAMELIRGEKLSDMLARQRLPAARSLELAAEIAAGLARAHEKGIVHRDLKPSNVMVTDEGHAKIIDFGIAKLIEVSTAAGAQTQTSHDTGVGVVLGTMTYMSPEQARAETVDHRSDIFSFGIVLHEMLAGQPPFRGKTGIETASAILHEPAPRLPSLGPAVIAEAGADIQRIVDKCLAKDPADRYQGLKDAVVDIRAARRRLDTGPQAVTVPAASAPLKVPMWGWLAAAVTAAATAGFVLFNQNGSATNDPAPTGGSGKPSVAVLFFDNATGDKSIDWMRTGITEMVVTDLSQSQDLEVIGTDRLYSILAELRRQDDRVVTPEVITAIAERTGVDRVVVGSYVKAGEAIRINVRLQDARTGRIESSERVEGANAAALFSMIDELSSRIRTKFAGFRADAALLTKPFPGAAAADRGLGDVTTSSIEAYRLYAEGMELTARARYLEAVPMFEQAVAIDPTFAMAYAKLAVNEGNLGHFGLRDKYAAQALKLADRLTPRERFYIEGYYYNRTPATVGQSMAAYRKCLEVDPGHVACRHNLALQYNIADRYQEGIAEYEELMRRGLGNASAVNNLCLAYIAVGELDKARLTAEAFLKQNPGIARAHGIKAGALLAAGRTDEALLLFTQSRQLAGPDPQTGFAIAVTQILREDWQGVDAVAKELLGSADETARFFGAAIKYAEGMLRGRSTEALQWAEKATSAYKDNRMRTAGGHQMSASALVARGQLEQAVPEVAKAVTLARGTPGDVAAALLQAQVSSATGRSADAEAAFATLAARIDPTSEIRDRRNLELARGIAALARGNATAAVAPLQSAAAALPPRSGNFLAPSPHLNVWSSLGQALLEAGKPAEALPWFRKCAESGFEHIYEPAAFVRSFYFLGRIYEQQGDTAQSREAYRRFVGYWKDGDLDRARIAEAQKKAG